MLELEDKLFVAFTIFAILVFALTNFVFAEPYKCTDHYSLKYCQKIGAVKETPTTVTNIIVTNTTALLNTEVNRDTIDQIKSTITRFYENLAEFEKTFKESSDSIPALEIAKDNAEENKKKAEAKYRQEPNETTRIQLKTAEEKYDKAKDDLRVMEVKKQTASDNIRKTNNEIILLTKELSVKQRTYHQEKKATGIQTVGVMLSKTCIAMLKNDMKSTCPTYQTLLALNLDTSKKESGKFSFFDGYYHRGSPLLKNDDKLYNFNDYGIIIDPSITMYSGLKLISIQPNFNNYLLPEDMIKVNNTRIVHKDRYVDSCQTAVINADTWLNTLSDTIQYLRTGCKGTLLDTVVKHVDNATNTNIEHSSKYKTDVWLKEAKEKYKQSYIGSQENSTNKAVNEDEDQ